MDLIGKENRARMSEGISGGHNQQIFILLSRCYAMLIGKESRAGMSVTEQLSQFKQYELLIIAACSDTYMNTYSTRGWGEGKGREGKERNKWRS